MKEKQRQHQDSKPKTLDHDGGGTGGMSEQASAALGQLAAADAMIDDILSSASTGNYLDSIRQRGGQ